MTITDEIKNELKNYLCDTMDNLLTRKQTEESEGKTDSSHKPFHAALLSNDMLKIADFERSFSTVMGGIFENCSSIIAKSRFTVEPHKELVGNISTNTNAEIDKTITRINKGDIFENYIDEVNRIVDFARTDTSDPVEKSIISDLYLKDKQNNEIFFEIKSPKPNKEQCLNITRRHLWIHAIKKRMFPETRTYFAMAYNPYGNGSYKHSFSVKYLDISNQVLIGKDFWDFLGGKDTYEELLEIFTSIGKTKTEHIRKVLDVNT